MQKTKTENKKTQKSKNKKPYIEKLLSKISPTKDEARVRLEKITSGFGYGFLSWVLSGGVLFFGTRPLSLALLCATETQLFPVFAGILISVIGKRSPISMLFGGIIILIFRIIISFVPDFHEKSRDDIKVTSIDLSSLDSDMLLEASGKSGKKINKERILEVLENLFGILHTEPQSSQSQAAKTRKYNESLPAKALFSGIGGFVFGLFNLIDSDYAFYDMFGALTLILGLPVLVILFSAALTQNVPFRSWKHTLSWFVILTFAVFAGKNTSFLGLYVSPFLGMLFSLFVTSFRGVVPGVICAGVFGLVYNPLYALPLILSCLIYAFISPIKKSFAGGGVCICVLLWCFYFGGTQGLVEALTPMLISLPILFLTEKYYPFLYPERDVPHTAAVDSFGKKQSAGVYFAEAVSQREKNEGMADRLGALSEAFSSLSQTFNGLVDRFRRPDMLGLKKMTEDTLESNCRDCRNRDYCWGAGYTQTLDISNKISSCLHTKGCVEDGDLPKEFSNFCPRSEKIIKDVNKSCEIATESIIQNQKMGIFASNFDNISEILRDALEGEGSEYECDLEASEKIFDFLSRAGYKMRGVVVSGKRNKRVLIKGAIVTPQGQSFSGAELCRILGEIVGTQLSGPVFEMSADETVMMFYSKPRLTAICSHGRLCADTDEESLYADILKDDGVSFWGSDSGENSSPCGDCTRVFVNESSYFYSLISDGMGSGEDAAIASEVCAMFVEKMLMAGNRADITVRMLNNFLRSENLGLGRECSATLDLFELDLMSGCASFIKSGAAPTYICREGKVYKVNSRTMPMGIIKKADAKLTKFDTKENDLVVMISDGCCPDSQDCPWLVDYLSGVNPPNKTGSPEQLEGYTVQIKNKILSLALENSPSDRHKDDISVSVVLISA